MCVVCFFLSACSTDKKGFEIGQKIPHEAVKNAETGYFMIHTGSLTKLYKMRKEDVDYYVAFNPQMEVIYLETSDRNFSTPEHLTMKATYADARKLAGSGPTIVPKWANFISLPSGWNVAFQYTGSADTAITGTTPVKMFFKKK